MTNSGLRSRWRCLPVLPDQDPLIQALHADLNLPPLLASLLIQRGIRTCASAQAFLNPRLTDLHDPSRLPGLTAAATRIAQAVADKQPIVIYGDYDVDGITASAILWHILRQAGASVCTYVPHRIEEGYGLNSQAIAQIAGGLPDAPVGKPLIVSVDCGITAREPAQAAKNAGIDLIITDHHQFDPDQLPEAHVLVHPRLPGSTYPWGELCGAGVAFKLAWQFAVQYYGSSRVPSDVRALLLDLVSLAALGTITDIVPLVDENRALAHFGLGQIKRTRFTGLNALIDASRLRDEKVDAYHVGFVLGPRLNACGRMGHAREAVKLLTDADPAQARAISEQLTLENERRRAAERTIFEQAQQMVVEAGYDQPDQRAIVLAQTGWHPGVIGIVASRLVEAFHRPVVMLSCNEQEAHGSARSVEGLSIHQALGHCSSHLTSFGGHAMAAGLRLPLANIDAFRSALLQYANQRLEAADLTSELVIDADCQPGDLNLELFERINHMAPFGAGNSSPVLRCSDALLIQPVERMGSRNDHLRLPLRIGTQTIKAVWFGAGDLANQLHAGDRLTVAFEPKVSTWQGRRRLEMHIQDVCVPSHRTLQPSGV